MLISTRLHGMIDYTVALMLGGLAACPAVPVPIRKLLGTAGAFHAGYAIVTDYEGGAKPSISMPQHLALDALGGAALIGAGLLMHRQSTAARAGLLAAGLAELAVVSVSSSRPRSGPGQGFGPVGRLLDPQAQWASRTSYPPLDVPKPVAQDVFIVDSQLSGTMGSMLPVRMTVLRLPDGGLLLHSPTRYSKVLKQALDAIGPVRHLVAPNLAHWMFLQEWQAAYPEATTWAAPGLRDRKQVHKSGLRLDRELTGDAPGAWGGAVELVMVPGGFGFHETALFHHSSRTLMLTDLVMNLEAEKVPSLLRPIARLFGITDGMPPPYLRAVVKLRREEAAQAAQHLISLQPSRVIFAHGEWFEQNGTGALRQALRWLLP
jgi:hypothetical protein